MFAHPQAHTLLAMKNLPFAACLLLLFLAPAIHFAQTPQPYFQQEVNYRIVVRLDDSTHTLDGHVEMQYVNHSPDTLSEIWMHLWGNAFKNRRTAFCKQKLRDGSARFYFAEDKDLGYFKNLDFSANGQKIEWHYDERHPDIARLKLFSPLLPGARVTLATPFFLKIPASFSRLGHVGTSYQMTQWYPKPAVYDHKGWHPMPYLDQGEFYSEFGAFDVTITLPENYVVGATGILQTLSEIDFLKNKEAESREKLAKGVDKKKDPFPPSSSARKTIRFVAERVHDFAWFADKRFFVLKDTAQLASGRTVECWAMFTNAESDIWEKGAFYVRRAVEFYSEKVGEYPWPQATAVHSALSAGGGMEYPMITVIGNSSSAKQLDEVITHEVGHNWFYGILASNERDHPFMDEGLNSYYEFRYMKTYYEGSFADDILPKFVYDPAKSGPPLHSAQLVLAREHKDTPPDSHSNDFAPIAYGLQVYMKTALCLHWLEQAVGTERLDAAMRDYYQQWRFRHPYPEDLRAVFEKHQLNADWFFDAMQTQKKSDFALKSIQRGTAGDWTLHVVNKGDLRAPFPVTALSNGKPAHTKWYSSPGELNFPTVEADAFVVDDEYATLDLNRKNNLRRTSGFLPGFEPVAFGGLTPFQSPYRSTIAVLPWLGWNNYDKTMLGAVIYNPPLPSRRLQYYLAPGYGFGSGQLVGLADVRYHFFPGGLFPKISVGASAKTFHLAYNWRDDYYSKFYRVAPQVRAELRDNSVSFRHFLNLRTLFVGIENDLRDSIGGFVGKEFDRYTIYEARYEAEQRKLPNPWRLVSAVEWQNGRDAFGNEGKYLRSTLEWRQQFFYSPKRKITMRAFAGGFLHNARRDRGIVAGDPAQASLALNPQGFNDYRFDHVFLARGGERGILGRQVSQTEGGFKGAFGPAFASTIGVSNNFVLALNLKADFPKRLPLGLPVKPWFDIGYYDDATLLGENRPSSEQWMWSGGFMLEFLNGGLEIYFPVVHSKFLKNKYNEVFGGNYWRWISWSMRLDRVQPQDVLERFVR